MTDDSWNRLEDQFTDEERAAAIEHVQQVMESHSRRGSGFSAEDAVVTVLRAIHCHREDKLNGRQSYLVVD